jgi:hypothetical protein
MRCALFRPAPAQNPTDEAEQQKIFSSEEQRRRLTNISLQQEIDERKLYALRSYKFSKVWVWFLIIVSFG